MSFILIEGKCARYWCVG